MIGAGASGFQIAPTIAPEVDHLTVFQRTAQWMFPNPNYHATVGPGVRWALRHLPFYGRWYRFLILWPGCDKGLEAARVDPDYPDQQRAVSEMNELTRQMFTDWIVGQVGDDPELVAKVVPDYPATGKRTLQDNGAWLGALTRDNVDLVRTAIDHIEPDAVVTVDGERYPADVLVYATGFRATEVLFPMAIVGPGRRRPPDACGASGRPPTSGSPCPASPTSSACTARAPTWPTAAASSSTPSARCGTSPSASRRSSPAATGPWSRSSSATRTGTSGPSARCGAWCGPSRPSSTRSSRTRPARSTCSVPGASSTTGPGPAEPDLADFAFA